MTVQPRSNEQNKPLAMSRFDFSLTPLSDLKLVQRKAIEEHHSLVGSTLCVACKPPLPWRERVGVTGEFKKHAPD